MEEDAVLSAGLGVMDQLIRGEYDEVYEELRSDVRDATTASALEDVMDTATDGLGEPKEVTDTMVFVEVKQHATLTPYGRRLRSVDRSKRVNLRRACNAWRRVNKWRGSFRFDVIEIYGDADTPRRQRRINQIENAFE